MCSSLSFYPVGIAREDYRHLMGSHALPKPFPGFVAGCRARLHVCSNHLGTTSQSMVSSTPNPRFANERACWGATPKFLQRRAPCG